MAELYDKIGLKNLAGEEYSEAEFLAKAKRQVAGESTRLLKVGT